MKKIKKYQATRRLRKESEYKEPLSSPVPRTRKNLEASVASRFFYCPETLFSLMFSLIVPQASETLLINCSIRSALSCFICFVTCP